MGIRLAFKIGWGTRIRTLIGNSRGCSPAVRRSPNCTYFIYAGVESLSRGWPATGGSCLSTLARSPGARVKTAWFHPPGRDRGRGRTRTGRLRPPESPNSGRRNGRRECSYGAWSSPGPGTDRPGPFSTAGLKDFLPHCLDAWSASGPRNRRIPRSPRRGWDNWTGI